MNKRIMLNEDDTHFLYTRAKLDTLSESDIRAFIRQYEASHVSDMLLCCAGRLTDYPSRVRDSWLDKYDQQIENGEKVDYRAHPVISCAHRLWRELGLDFYAICIDELKNIGVNPWLSIRMNDCHDNDKPTSFLHPRAYHEHPEYRRVTYRAPKGYFDNCFDYAQKDVRDMMLACIEEIALRYDVYGIELDWQREIYCFKPGGEWAGIQIITEFMRNARGILSRAAQKWGHDIKLCARTLPDPQKALDCGFDVANWAREGLIDVLVPSPRWGTADFDIPVELWKRLLYGTDVILAIGIEILVRTTRKDKYAYATRAHARALAAQYLSMGADKIYLFNYMDNMTADADELKQLKETHGEDCALLPDNYRALIREIGDARAAINGERRHMITYSDIGPAWYGVDRHAPLPVTMSAADIETLRVRTGEIPECAKVQIILGVQYENPENIALYVNGKRARLSRAGGDALTYEAVNDGTLSPFLVLEIISQSEAFTINSVEARIAAE